MSIRTIETHSWPNKGVDIVEVEITNEPGDKHIAFEAHCTSCPFVSLANDHRLDAWADFNEHEHEWPADADATPDSTEHS